MQRNQIDTAQIPFLLTSSPALADAQSKPKTGTPDTMDHSEILAQAVAIVRDAGTKVRNEELEATVTEFERSEVRSLRSLARVYRMLQWPPQQ
ncbi:MAG TPA: hypothetical protein VMV65_08685 [Alphaproteobacteria bacterium]|nr:hypothetical protein [Alphaproteobacteria bacterium]